MENPTAYGSGYVRLALPFIVLDSPDSPYIPPPDRIVRAGRAGLSKKEGLQRVKPLLGGKVPP